MTLDQILDARQDAGLCDAQDMQLVMSEALAQAEVLLDDLCSKLGVTYRWYPAQEAVSIEVER